MRPVLDGVRVIDLSRVLAAPFAARVLAEMGAEVTKVEYGRGDPAHAIGPHRAGRSLYFSSLNSGKHGLYVDLREAPDRRRLDALIASSDVVVENFRPSTAHALGLDAPSLLDRHPHLVVTSVTSYARDSDRADEGAFDLTVQAESGLMAVTGEPGRAPVRAGVPIADLAAGLFAVAGTIAALFARERDGLGRHVDVPMLDASVSLLAYLGTTALATQVDPQPVGSGHHNAAPYGAYATADGWIVIAALADKFWVALCAALELDDLLARPDLETNAGRARARAEIDGAVALRVGEMSTVAALDVLRRAGVPHAPVNGVIEALTAPYVAARGCVERISGPEGPYDVVTTPLRERGVELRAAPSLDQGAVARARGLEP